MPSFFSQVPINDVTFCLEKNRREFYIATFNAHKQEQKYFLLFKLGEETKPEENTYSTADLGFSECYFQFWVMTDLKNHFMFPLTEEAYIQTGFHLEFDRQYKLRSHRKLTECPVRMMRPTPVPMRQNRPDRNTMIAMIGGDENRRNYIYDTVRDTWEELPKLPIKHNVACLPALNYKDKAIFTFMADGKFNFKAACMPFTETPEGELRA